MLAFGTELFSTNCEGLRRFFNRLGDRNPPKPQFDSVVATEVGEGGTMGWEDPPVRRT